MQLQRAIKENLRKMNKTMCLLYSNIVNQNVGSKSSLNHGFSSQQLCNLDQVTYHFVPQLPSL